MIIIIIKYVAIVNLSKIIHLSHPLCALWLEISSTYFQDGDATADDNIVTDIFHYASCFTSDEGQ